MLFKNRLEIWNPGRLPSSLNIEKLRHPHPSIPTNPLLANPMYLTGYIERMGTGTGDIIRKCVDAGLRAPDFIQEEDFKVILWRTDQAKMIDKKVIELIKIMDKPYKRAELQKALGLKHNPTFRTNYLDVAISEGYIVQSHPNNPTHPDQYYSLTEKGVKLREWALKK